jgi:alanyl-tRNA synthetase
MDVPEIRSRFLRFYAERGHAVIPAAPIVPAGDASTLFITAGMQPLVPFFLGERHPAGRRVVDVQPCVRTDDIDEVGDPSHLTFLEMLGRWSLGDYDGDRAVELTFDLLTGPDGLGLDPQRLYVTVFAGDHDAPRDSDVEKRWKALFASADIDPERRVFAYGKAENWWGPVGPSGPRGDGGPCGPDSELFVDTGAPHDPAFGPHCHPACPCDRLVEIGNDVFLRYDRQPDGRFLPLTQRSVDTGMGLERLAQVLQGLPSVYETGAFRPLVEWVEARSGRPYASDERSVRIVTDHVKAATFIASAGVAAGNVGQGYVLRRLVRRAVRYGRLLELPRGFTAELGGRVIDLYPELSERRDAVLGELADEEERFGRTLRRGLRRVRRLVAQGGEVSGADGFSLHDTHGFPVELTRDVVGQEGGRLAARFEEDYRRLMAEQQERSRTAGAGAFRGGLADRSKESVWFHTLTHLTLAALRQVLGEHVHQRGSNITAERLRLDYSHGARLSDVERAAVEARVNQALRDDLPVESRELRLEDALASGALAEFGHKYGDVVTVYTIADEHGGQVVSRELCGGPHVARTGEIDGCYAIVKDESVGAGVRRIRAVLKDREDRT